MFQASKSFLQFAMQATRLLYFFLKGSSNLYPHKGGRKDQLRRICMIYINISIDYMPYVYVNAYLFLLHNWQDLWTPSFSQACSSSYMPYSNSMAPVYFVIYARNLEIFPDVSSHLFPIYNE